MYRIYPENLSIILIVFIVILWNILANVFGVSLPLFLFVLFLGIVLASCRFTYTIHEHHAVFRVILFKNTIWNKEIHPGEIRQLKFIRTGWARKAVIIKFKKGINHRFSVQESGDEAYTRLMDFANAHDIEVVKTKDYGILERMNRASKES